jgi:hypothetical protein
MSGKIITRGLPIFKHSSGLSLRLEIAKNVHPNVCSTLSAHRLKIFAGHNGPDISDALIFPKKFKDAVLVVKRISNQQLLRVLKKRLKFIGIDLYLQLFGDDEDE